MDVRLVPSGNPGFCKCERPRRKGTRLLAVTFLLALAFEPSVRSSGAFAEETRWSVAGLHNRETEVFPLPNVLGRGKPTPSGAFHFSGMTTAESDISSVTSSSTMHADGGRRTTESDYLNAEAPTEALVSSDTGKFVGTSQFIGVLHELKANRTIESEVVVAEDNFLGHTRKYLQTKK